MPHHVHQGVVGTPTAGMRRGVYSCRRLGLTGGVTMVKVSVFYPNGKSTRFDIGYYCDRHIPLVQRLLGSALKSVSVEHGICGERPGT